MKQYRISKYNPSELTGNINIQSGPAFRTSERVMPAKHLHYQHMRRLKVTILISRALLSPIVLLQYSRFVMLNPLILLADGEHFLLSQWMIWRILLEIAYVKNAGV